MQSTRSMLQLEYPEHEVIIVNDGSTDRTLQLLIDEFHLYKSSRQPLHNFVTGPVNAVYESQNLKLLVIDKEEWRKVRQSQRGNQLCQHAADRRGGFGFSSGEQFVALGGETLSRR